MPTKANFNTKLVLSQPLFSRQMASKRTRPAAGKWVWVKKDSVELSSKQFQESGDSCIYNRNMLLRVYEAIFATHFNGKERASSQQDPSAEWVQVAPQASLEDALSKRRNRWPTTEYMLTPHITTVMLRNIPYQCKRDALRKRIEQKGFAGLFDFLYLPFDHKSGRSKGYAFINFRTPEVCQRFYRAFNGVEVKLTLPGSRSRKTCEVHPAKIQGTRLNYERAFGPKGFMHLVLHDEWRPLFWDEKNEPIPPPKAAAGIPAAATSELMYQMPQPPMIPGFPCFWPTLSNPVAPWSLEAAGFSRDQAEEHVAKKRSSPQMRATAPEFVPLSQLRPAVWPIAPLVNEAATPLALAAQHHTAQEQDVVAAIAGASRVAVPSTRARASQGNVFSATRKQVEHHFSKENLCHDIYLRSLMDANGWVELKELAELPCLRQVSCGRGASFCARAVVRSKKLQLSEDGLLVRVRDPELRAAFSSLKDSSQSQSPVGCGSAWLHVYDIGGAKGTNDTIHQLGLGIFHVGIEVYDVEWSFGYADPGPEMPLVSGVYAVPPKTCSFGTYRESVLLGPVKNHRAKDVWMLMRKMAVAWLGTEYHPFRRNCLDFCEALAEGLGVERLPGWVGRLARVANVLLNPLLDAFDMQVLPRHPCALPDDAQKDEEEEDLIERGRCTGEVSRAALLTAVVLDFEREFGECLEVMQAAEAKDAAAAKATRLQVLSSFL